MDSVKLERTLAFDSQFVGNHVKGFNHLALVSSDLEKTIAFVSGILGFPLVYTVDLYSATNTRNGKHIFFDIGGNNVLSYIWFPNAPPSQPGISSANIPNKENGYDYTSGHGSMNHISFEMSDLESLKLYHKQLINTKGIRMLNKQLVYHTDDSNVQGIKSEQERLELSTFVSFYVYGPDNELFEFTYPMLSKVTTKNASKL